MMSRRSERRTGGLAWAALLLVALLVQMAVLEASSHIEDICVAPPDAECPKCGVYNFYTLASRIGCKYRQNTPKCIAATTAAQAQSGFVETSVCRGVIHFNAIYFIAAVLGFKQEIAHHMAAFSQAIDFVQYRAVDSCGRNMSAGFWTPPMRGLLRTEVSFGGTNRHLGIPWVGMFKTSDFDLSPADLSESSLTSTIPLLQKKKKYTGTRYRIGCRRDNYRRSFAHYGKHCGALTPNLNNFFYEGSLSSARRWAFMDTDLLCVAGMTVEDPKTGSIFTGDSCPKKGKQFQVNVGAAVEGPIPLSGPQMQLGDQVIHFECQPNCTAPSYTVKPGSEIYSANFGKYLKDQSDKYGYATLSDPPGPVPEAVARFGIYLHWLADRASHWYCCDASRSGLVTIREDDHYNSFVFLGVKPCNFVNHGLVHYWEQGVSDLAPGSYFALVNTFKEIKAFRKKFKKTNPEWFRPGARAAKFKTVIGTKKKPGTLYRITNIVDARQRFKAEVKALRTFKAPPMPGFESMCPKPNSKRRLETHDEINAEL